MRPVVEAIGLNWKGQHAKLLADKDKFSCVDIHTPDGRGHKQVMTCILVSKFALWLASINPAKIPHQDARALNFSHFWEELNSQRFQRIGSLQCSNRKPIPACLLTAKLYNPATLARTSFWFMS